MKNINLLVVEGNIQKENDNFRQYGIQTHAESLKDSLEYYSKDLNIDRCIYAISRIIPSHLMKAIDIVYVGKFDFLDQN